MLPLVCLGWSCHFHWDVCQRGDGGASNLSSLGVTTRRRRVLVPSGRHCQYFVLRRTFGVVVVVSVATTTTFNAANSTRTTTTTSTQAAAIVLLDVPLAIVVLLYRSREQFLCAVVVG